MKPGFIAFHFSPDGSQLPAELITHFFGGKRTELIGKPSVKTPANKKSNKYAKGDGLNSQGEPAKKSVYTAFFHEKTN